MCLAVRNKAITKNGGHGWIPVSWVLKRREMELMTYSCPPQSKVLSRERSPECRWLGAGIGHN